MNDIRGNTKHLHDLSGFGVCARCGPTEALIMFDRPSGWGKLSCAKCGCMEMWPKRFREPKIHVPQKKPVSKYRGVKASPNNDGRWQANYGKKYLGMYDIEEDAARAYNDYAREWAVCPRLNIIPK